MKIHLSVMLILLTVTVGENEVESSPEKEMANNILNMASHLSHSMYSVRSVHSVHSVHTTHTTHATVDSADANASLALALVVPAPTTTALMASVSATTTAKTATSASAVASVNYLGRSIAVHTTMSYLEGDAVRHISGRGFTIPHFHLPDSRWGPFFEEGTEPQNITARLGSTVTLDCRIALLHDKTVTWLHHKEDSIHLLTVGRNVYSSDERVTLSFRYPNNWRLVIVYVTRRDEGLYECQVATHPPKVKRLFLKIIAPEVILVDEQGREVTERYYKEGSTLELTCIGTQADLSDTENTGEEEIMWRHGDQTITSGISSNSSVRSDTVVSTLVLSPIEKHHSGNYTCAINGLTSATVSVHVLNGELPAAVHLGNGAQRSHIDGEWHSRWHLGVFLLVAVVSCVIPR